MTASEPNENLSEVPALANTKSAKKSIKVNERKRLRNQAVRSAVKTAIRKANEAIKAAPAKAVEANRAACSVIDKAAVGGSLHKNTAARKKSRLARRLNKAKATATA